MLNMNRKLEQRLLQYETQAKSCFSNEEYGTAIRYFKRALKIKKKIRGEAHPNFLRSLEFLSDIYADLGMFDNASNLIIWGLSPIGDEPFTIESIGDNNEQTRAQLAKVVVGELFANKKKVA